MSRLLILVTLLLALVLGSSNAVVAQADDVDIDAAASAALDADPEALVEGLEERPADSLLPDGFENPSSGTPENEEFVESFEGGLGTVDDTVGQVTHGFDTDPSVVPGEVSAGILTYIVTNDEITDDMLDEYEAGMEEGMADTAGMSAEIDRTEIGGTDAVVLTLVQDSDGVFVTVTMVSVPVGNTMVVSTVFAGGTEEIESAELQPMAEELALAGAGHVGEAAEEASN